MHGLSCTILLLAADGIAAFSPSFAGSLLPTSQICTRPTCISMGSAVQTASPAVLDTDGKESGQQTLSWKTSDKPAYLLHRKLLYDTAMHRAGTASTLTRAEVRGGGRKPYKQKGTGNARRGSTRSPLIKGGGVIFGPKPKNWAHDMNKKERQLAMKTAIMSKMDNTVIIDGMSDAFTAPKTKDFVSFLDRVDAGGKKVYVVMEDLENNAFMSGRNLPNVRIASLRTIQMSNFIWADKILISKPAMEVLNERYTA